MTPLETIEQLEDALSRPTPGVLDTLRQLDGDLMVLGAGGKMGPTLARMVRRGLDALGQTGAGSSRCRVIHRGTRPGRCTGMEWRPSPVIC